MTFKTNGSSCDMVVSAIDSVSHAVVFLAQVERECGPDSDLIGFKCVRLLVFNVANGKKLGIFRNTKEIGMLQCTASLFSD